jgi:uncharacterized SAM-binding protein YcdF (DUF218 family)
MLAQPRKSSYWAGGASIAILLAIVGIKFLGDQLYDFPINPTIQTQKGHPLVACLAGGKGRIEAAMDLFASGVGSELFIIGAGPKMTVPLLLKNTDKNVVQKLSNLKIGAISLERESANTIENAYVLERFLVEQPLIQDVIVVTSGYHMRRSLYVLNTLLQRKVNLIPYTPPDEAFDRDNWWHSRVGIVVTLEEYFKYLGAQIVIPRLAGI